jgi:hypothetical protein
MERKYYVIGLVIVSSLFISFAFTLGADDWLTWITGGIFAGWSILPLVTFLFGHFGVHQKNEVNVVNVTGAVLCLFALIPFMILVDSTATFVPISHIFSYYGGVFIAFCLVGRAKK